MKPIVILICIETFLHVKKSNYNNIQWFLSYTHKCVKKWQKSGFSRDAKTLKPNKDFHSKFDRTI